ncbi:hypothetical protein Spa11_42660 [Botrimarina mediterranea]|uniref:Bacterial type II secretion system protein G n=2 Tax=Botrimarina mediterranea TaxID=2528022 RepID=A0A518KE22_9BACT|nr:hypothetical protein Spa11_42660 [Botrimarina mediterranea]
MLPFWLLIVTILIVFGYCLYATVGPNPPIIVSKATTHLTTPLGKDGLPDYAAVLLADAMKGVTPETNAAVPLLESMDIEEFDKLEPSEKDNLKLVFDKIGAAWPPDETRAIPSLFSKEVRIGAVRLYRERVPRPADIEIVNIGSGGNDSEVDESVVEPWDDDCCGISDEDFWRLSEEEVANDERARFYYDSMLDRPWSQNDLPFVADWFHENAETINAIVAGLDRPEWALPKSGWIRGERDPSNWLDIFAMTGSRQIARTLLVRTLYDIGEQDWQAARRDGLAIMKLATHLANDVFVIDQLVANAIDGMAASAIRRIALDLETPADELRALLKEFDAIGPASRMSDTMDSGERYYCLNEVITCANSSDLGERLVGTMSMTTFQAEPLPALVHQTLCRCSVDWNVVLRRFNTMYDQVVVAAKITNGRDRRIALQPIDAEIGAAQERVQSTASGLGRMWTSAARGELAADVLQSQSFFGFEQYFAIEDRNRIDRALTRTTIALAIYRAEHGEYPESLDDLAPDVLPTAPVDPVYGDPLSYRRTDGGFLVYSLGFNGVDDNGSNDGESLGYGFEVFEGIRTDEMDDETEAANLTAKIPKGADDLSLRVPLPIKPWPWERATGEGSDDAASDPLMAD